MEKIKSVFSKRLHTLRIKKNLSTNSIAKSIDVRVRSVQFWEDSNYDIMPTYQNLIKLCKLLDCSTDYLLGLSDT